MTPPIEDLILSVVDEVYGEDADIYHDVLGIPPTASIKIIKKAFSERRSELAHLSRALQVEEEKDEITASHLKKVERKMEALHLAAHILADRKLRDVYDRRELPYRGKLAGGSGAPNVIPALKKEVEPQSRTGGRGLIRVLSFGKGKKKSSLKKKNLTSANFESTSEALPPSSKAPYDSSSYDNTSLLEEPTKMQRMTSTAATIGVHHTASNSNRSGTKTQRNRKQVAPLISSSSNEALSDHQKQQQQAKRSRPSVPNSLQDSIAMSPPPPPPPPPQPTVQSMGQQQRHHRSVSFNEQVQEATPILNQNMVDDDDSLTLDPSIYSAYSEGDWEYDEPPSCLSKYIVSRGYIRKVKHEVEGALEDTTRSFSQVMNVFTLTDKDVEAVTGRIDKANKQFRKDRLVAAASQSCMC